MSVAAWGRTWEDASTPSAARLTRRYEQAWRDSEASGSRPDPRAFLSSWTEPAGFPGARLALLRTDMSLRWEAGQQPAADWYVKQFPELGEDTVVALIYEEFCLREEAGEAPQPSSFLTQYPSFATALKRVFDIHQLVGSGSTSAMTLGSTSFNAADDSPGRVAFPKAGQTIAGFQLVEELGRGSFARVFLARETQLADRLVALKLSLRGSREPQTLARLQHTHIVPVHSHRIDPVTELHLLCMPYFGRVTLARILTEVERANAGESLTGHTLVEALDHLEPSEGAPAGPSTGRNALSGRTFSQAVAWWGARLTEALGHAHDRGVLHRDVKPSNVLIAADGTPMLLDFNLAHESIVSEEEGQAGASLGGTVDYMAPEHLEALAEARSDYIDARSDLFSMGVLLYEATLGGKPFAPPRKVGSVVETLLRAADDRRKDPHSLFPADSDVPAPLRAVIERCLAPEPDDRYQSADELALDLQAVADDLPLPHAREPFLSRMTRRLHRNRLRLATAALILISCSAVAIATFNLSIERAARYEQGRELFNQGNQHLGNGDFDKAILQYEAASQLARRSEKGIWGQLFHWRSPREILDKLNALERRNNLELLDEQAGQKAQLAKRHAATHNNAAALHAASDGLRMRLIGLGEDLAGAVHELQELLKPFYVLNSREDWTKLDYLWPQLDEVRRARLRLEVNELLFLWMVGVESSLQPYDPSDAKTADDSTIRLAIEVCDKALGFAEPRGPWLALQNRFRMRLKNPDQTTVAKDAEAVDDEPKPAARYQEPNVADESSALACFQWGLLNSSHNNRGRAILWLQRAVRIDWSNYWYQFYLGFLEDQAGLRDEALDQYSVAAALKPESPWVLFSRARLYRMKGRWSWAIEDLKKTLSLMGDRPESLQVRLELGYVYQALGDFSRAREQYAATLKIDPKGDLGRAARLNIANIDAESGFIDRAQAGYDELLADNTNDTAARYSRALLDIRIGRPQSASPALDLLIQNEHRNPARSDLLATRAVVRMMLGRNVEAVADAREARRLDPTPAHDRLVSRSLLAAGLYDQIQFDRPEELALFPLGGDALKADMIAADVGLAQWGASHPKDVYRVDLTRAVILSALGRHIEAVKVAQSAVAASNQNSPNAHLVAARVAYAAADRSGSLEQVERGLRLQADEAGLLELRGVLRTEAGKPDAALGDFDLALARLGGAFAHARKAEALHALRRVEEAAQEWTLCLRRDPEISGAYLGRARCYMDLPQPLWEQALADLEHAASWVRDDPRTEFGVLIAYARCLRERPDRATRWLALLQRSAVHAWQRARSFSPLLDLAL